MIVMYLLIAACGLVGTWFFNITSFTRGEDYIGGWFAGAASTSAAVDVLVTAVAAGVFFVIEGRRLGMRNTWLLIPLTFLLALAFTFPLFLAWRERALTRAGAPESVGGQLMPAVARLQANVQWAWRISPGLTALTMVNAVTLVLAIIFRLVDPTFIAGVPAWNKPIKFSLSFLAFGPSMLFIYSRVQLGRVGRVALELTGWAMVLEIVLIVMQAARGVMSHFNYTTRFDATVFTAMAAGTGVFALGALIAGVVLARRRLPGLVGLAISLSVPIMTVGAIQGFSMTAPKPGQIEAGRSIVGGHSIGGTDGPALPFLGWSTEHGDLRPAHFIGLHVLQILPLIAVALTVLAARGVLKTSERRLRGAVWAAAAAYLGLIVTLYLQAQRGQSVVEPDAFTAVTALLLIGLPGAAAFSLALVPARRPADVDRSM